MDLLADKFKGYKISYYQEFIKCIKNEEDNYEEGENLSPDKLMNLTDIKFKIMKGKGVWNFPSKEGENIIALEAGLEKLKKVKPKVEVKKKSKYVKKKDVNKFKGERKQKL